MIISMRYVEAVISHKWFTYPQVSHFVSVSLCLFLFFFLENAYSLASFSILLILLQKQLT